MTRMLAAVGVAALALTACGGGGGNSAGAVPDPDATTTPANDCASVVMDTLAQTSLSGGNLTSSIVDQYGTQSPEYRAYIAGVRIFYPTGIQRGRQAGLAAAQPTVQSVCNGGPG